MANKNVKDTAFLILALAVIIGSRLMPVSYTHLDVYKRQGVDGDVNVEVIPADGSEFTEGMQVILNPGPMTVDGALVTVLPQM